MRRAILSDIHGNLEALKAVLADIEKQKCDEVICLGDIVGYGPNPCECVDLVMQLNATILGNHDLGALFDPEGFSNAAEQAIFWTRKQIEQGSTSQRSSPEQIRRRLDFLARLPRVRREGRLTFVHGSIRNPINEYVFPEDVFNRRKIDKLFSMIQPSGYCFQGHTHVPGVFTPEFEFIRPHECDHQFVLGDAKYMVNVGSVGQPRDAEWRSCYVVLDGSTVSFRRVEYDIETTVEKIYAIDELDAFLGDRLREGR